MIDFLVGGVAASLKRNAGGVAPFFVLGVGGVSTGWADRSWEERSLAGWPTPVGDRRPPGVWGDPPVLQSRTADGNVKTEGFNLEE